MRIAMAADHAGVELKDELIRCLHELGHQVTDLGTNTHEPVDYPDFADRAAEAVLSGAADRAIFTCGSGLGPAIAANKIPGIRAVTAHDPYSARYSRLDNDANFLSLGQRVIGPGLAKEIVHIWLETEFSGAERHRRRLEKIERLARAHAPCSPDTSASEKE
ncbi:MAG: ribose 5-phosphate isomerase B [Armatimonadetes bacterium]|nr:ribose 5-phosphate isomerase B [Armatimonadota bacterium]